MLISGLGLGLWGYDTAFTAPLVSLPLFVEKYQGPGVNGSLAFTVKYFPYLILEKMCLTTEAGPKLGSYDCRSSNWRCLWIVNSNPSPEMVWPEEVFASCLLALLYSSVTLATVFAQSRVPGCWQTVEL